ncbi:hypothetical protein F5X97DRAFT_341899 [Nemania serpens]|nr:hypothetical protein F5X97DRAFT_341899 [Nemania serpens]
MSDVIPIIKGYMRDGRSFARQVLFTNLEDLTDSSFVAGNPNRYYSGRRHVVPLIQHDLPIAPNFFFTVKGPDGSLAVAERQACYNGALGARGMNNVVNKAYTLTSTYQNGALKIYASYLLPCDSAGTGMRYEYAMTQIDAYALTGNIDTFKTGAEQKRDEAVKRANEAAAAA